MFALCGSRGFGVRTRLLMNAAMLSWECAGHRPLVKGCGWCTLGDRDSSLLSGCHHPVRGGVCSPVVGIEVWCSGLIRPHRPWGHALPRRRWLPKWGLSGPSGPVFPGSTQAPVVALRSSSGSHPFLCCLHPRSSARLWCGAGWGRDWGLRHCGYEDWDDCAATWDPGCLWQTSPGTVCPSEWDALRSGRSWSALAACEPLTVLTAAPPGSHPSLPCHLCTAGGVPVPGPVCQRLNI